MLQVVHALPQDARAVAEIHIHTWRVAYASFVPADYLASLSVDHSEAMWQKCIAAQAPELLVAKHADALQGWISFGACRDDDAPKTEAEIWALYVSPSAWSTGAGRLLWLRAKERMLAQGFNTCALWVFPQNERAIKFYQRAGFVQDGAKPKDFELGGVPLQEIRFVAQLDG